MRTFIFSIIGLTLLLATSAAQDNAVEKRKQMRLERQALERRIKAESATSLAIRIADPKAIANQILNGVDLETLDISNQQKEALKPAVIGYRYNKTHGNADASYHASAFNRVERIYFEWKPKFDIAEQMLSVPDSKSFVFQGLYRFLDADQDQQAVLSSIVEASNRDGKNRNKYANQIRRCLTLKQIRLTKSKAGQKAIQLGQ